MEMGRAGEAERFVGKALGLVKLGSTRAFAVRWEKTMYQVGRAETRSLTGESLAGEETACCGSANECACGESLAAKAS